MAGGIGALNEIAFHDERIPIDGEIRNWITLLLPAALAAQTPNSAESAKRAIATELRQFAKLTEFTFTYELMRRYFTKEGKFSRQSTESGETYMSGKRNADIMLVKNGKPLQGPRPRRTAQARRRTTDGRYHAARQWTRNR